MAAVAKFAVADQIPDFTEAELDLGWRHVPQTKLPNAGGVDQMAATGQMKQLGGGGGMLAVAVAVVVIISSELGSLR